MSPIKLLLACAIAAGAVGAHATPVYSVSAPSGAYGLPASFSATGNAGVVNWSDGEHVTPMGMPEGSDYLYTSIGNSSLTIDVNASSFSFLWGSPDSFNTVTYQTSLGDFVYTGSMLNANFGIADSGAGSTVFGASLAGGTINSVVLTSNGVAFEVAVAAVPEPETYALMAAGLMAIAFMIRRNKRS